MAKTKVLNCETGDAVVDICLDTLKKGKQALVFCNTKRGAESQAERLARLIKRSNSDLINLSEELLKTLPSPTKQCRRLSLCATKGVVFHHAGLHSKQRSRIEEEFRRGTVKIICATPTLAMGVDTPAFRVIIRDLKRFTNRGMVDIPVLEYEQQAGRAGRPGQEEYGEAIVIAKSEDHKEALIEKYLEGEPEEIYSKLAVEPVLRTYILSLVAAEFVTTRDDLYNFFDRTFYSKQYGDTRRLRSILNSMVVKLEKWGFLKITEKKEVEGFVSANRIKRRRDATLKPTLLGKRIAELYLDPYTAHFLLNRLERAKNDKIRAFSLLHLLASCLEMRPLLRPRNKEVESILEETAPYIDSLLDPEPDRFSSDYEEFLMTLKTALFLRDWVEEVGEDQLLEQYGIRPGEVRVKLERADWLLYATEELVRIASLPFRSFLSKMRLRLKYGVKEEILPLLRLRNVGRVRARKLFRAHITSIKAIREVDVSTLSQLLGKQIALDLKKQVGQDLSPEKVVVKSGKRKGQRSIKDY